MRDNVPQWIRPTGLDSVPMMVDRCVFVDGVEVYRGSDCPHVDDPDIGWTVQHG